MNSILETVKHALGLPSGPDYTFYDSDIIMHINTVISILIQMSIGINPNVTVTGPTETWDELLTFIPNRSHLVKTYMCLKVRMMFDPPTATNVFSSYDNMISELEWRIVHESDRGA